MEMEVCCECDRPTGRFEEADDSIYVESVTGDEIGPLCQDCLNSLIEEGIVERD